MCTKMWTSQLSGGCTPELCDKLSLLLPTPPPGKKKRDFSSPLFLRRGGSSSDNKRVLLWAPSNKGDETKLFSNQTRQLSLKHNSDCMKTLKNSFFKATKWITSYPVAMREQIFLNNAFVEMSYYRTLAACAYHSAGTAFRAPALFFYQL